MPFSWVIVAEDELSIPSGAFGGIHVFSFMHARGSYRWNQYFNFLFKKGIYIIN